MRCRYAMLATLACFLPFAAVQAADKADPVSAAKGKIIYVRYCASCHGVTGRGTEPWRPSCGFRRRT